MRRASVQNSGSSIRGGRVPQVWVSGLRTSVAVLILFGTSTVGVIPAVAQDRNTTAASSGFASESGAAGRAGLNQAAGSVVPRLIKFSGLLKDRTGNAQTGTAALTFSLYEDEEGGSPLWMETQSVQLNDHGHYTVLLGATQPDGIPLELFTSGKARWLGVQPQLPGEGEQPRILLVGVPYALKAADADTLGGKPASAFVTTETQGGSLANSAIPGENAQAVIQSPSHDSASQAASLSPQVTGSGTTNFIPIWASSTNLGSSTISEVGGTVNVQGTLQLPATGTATATKGFNSQPLDSLTSVYNSFTQAHVTERFRWLAEPTGNNTSTATGKLDLLFGSGSAMPAETGLSIGSNGIFTFALGQTFPGTGTITGVLPGVGVTGGGTNGTVSLGLDTGYTDARYASLGRANSFSGNQSVTGNVSATGSVSGTSGSFSGSLSGTQLISTAGNGTPPLTVASPTQVPNLNASFLGGLPAASFATSGSNRFIGDQNVLGNVFAQGTVEVDSGAANASSFLPGLQFGPGSGETISSNRNPGTNVYGLDFYTARTARVSVTNGGAVGIGTRAPGATLDVAGSFRVNGDTPMNSNPHMSFSGFINGDLGFGSGWAGGFFVPDRAITVTRITVRVGTQGFGCSTPPAVNVDDFAGNGSTAVSLSIPNSVTIADSGPVSVGFPAGDQITIDLTPTSGCGLFDFSPKDAFVNVEYIMQ